MKPPVPESPLDPDEHQVQLHHLRSRAERRLVSEVLPADTSPEVQRLVQELQMYQIELQMQYEELLQAQVEAETNRLQFIDLYDFAPVGYCTLSANGTLLQLNLRTSQLLGQARQRLVGRRLAQFVAPAERHQFAEFLARLWASPGRRQSCELAMRGPDDTAFFAQLEGVTTPDSPSEGQAPTNCRLVLFDVTARRQATDLLAASEARFRSTFEQARDGMVLLEGGRLVDMNAAALHLLGFSDKRRVLGRALQEFWPERQPDGRRSLDLLTGCMHTAQTKGWCRLEWMRYNAAGEEVWDEMSFNPVLVNGQPFLHGAWRDITSRKQSEQLLRESEARLQMALAAANTGVWAWELANNALYKDERAADIFGLPTPPGAAEPSFAALHAAIHPDDVAQVDQALQQAQHEHSVFDLEHRLMRADGSVRHVAVMGRFSYDERDGEAIRLVGLVRDVTARRQAEEELGYKNRLLGNVLQNLPMLLARVGPDGHYREQAGRALRRMDMADNSRVGMSAAGLFPEKGDCFARLLAGQPQSYQLRLQYKGEELSMQCFGFFDSERQEVIVLGLDISESEQLKKEATRLELRQQQEVLSAILTTQEEERRRIAEALHNGVGQLLYGTRLHLDMVPPSEAVRASQNLLNEAIRSVRTISFELTPSILEDFGLSVALHELVGRVPASSLAVDLNLRGLEAPLPSLLSTALYRIVQELLNNVIKHAKAQEVFVQLTREDDQVFLSVEDDGVGMDPDGPAQRQGIGLAGIRTRVGLLGGTLTIRSRPGHCTGVFLQLPVPASAEAPVEHSK